MTMTRVVGDSVSHVCSCSKEVFGVRLHDTLPDDSKSEKEERDSKS